MISELDGCEEFPIDSQVHMYRLIKILYFLQKKASWPISHALYYFITE